MKMIAVGDNVTDCYLDDGVYYPGGNAVNVAVGCARSHCFEEVAYLGIFGDDENAAHLRSCLEKEHVGLARCRRAYAPTAQPGVRLVSGDRQFVAGPRDSVAHLFSLALSREDMAYIGGFDLLHTSCFSHIEEELPRLAQTLAVSFDFSDAWDEPYLRRVCPSLRYAFFSGSHLKDGQVQDLIAQCHALGTRVVGVTQGERGAVFSAAGQTYRQVPKVVAAVDTMGAGDSFIAGFLSCYSTTHDMEKALDFAGSCAAATVQCHGGWGYPHPLGRGAAPASK